MLFLMIFTIKNVQQADQVPPGSLQNPQAPSLLKHNYCSPPRASIGVTVKPSLMFIFSRKMHIFLILFKCLIICSAKVKYFLITAKFQLVSVANFYINVIVLTIK